MIPWETTLDLDEALVPKLLKSQFPHLNFKSVSHLDSGWDSTAWETDTGLVFKFPKRMNAAAALMREKDLLGSLAGLNAIPLPQVLLTGAPSDGFPAPFIGYPKLQGSFLTEVPELPENWPALAKQAGQFLTQLGAAKAPSGLIETGLFSATFGQVAQFARRYHSIKALLSPETAQALKSELEEFDILPAPDYPLCVAHSDLTAVHILYDEALGRFSGVIDWADTMLCNPLIDFAGFYAWGGQKFFDEMLKHYKGPVTAEASDWLKQRCLVMGLFEAGDSMETGNLKDRKSALMALHTALAELRQA